MSIKKTLQCKNISICFLCICMILLSFTGYAQQGKTFTLQDTLRGSIGKGRIGWNVLHYDITVEPDFASKTIKGKNKITYFDSGVKLMQIDLQEPMNIDSIISDNQSLSFQRNGNVYFTQIRDTNAMYKIKPGKKELTIYFSGKPREAKRAPWDGGWIWKLDKQGNPWMTVACQGLGASVWYPCKDYQGDEPDNGAILRIIVPDSLVGIGNGRQIAKTKTANGKDMVSWEVKSPINNYNIVPYIGKYVHFGEVYKGLKGKLTMDYWVLDYNIEKATAQFKEAPRMMKAFEYWFGPYPFYKDGYKLVESPHLGMEHQSAVAYGNQFKNGYLGSDLSKSGWGLKFDFIIVHESGHEWFANNITTNDIADMWVHEGFTNYSEALFVQYYFGKEAGNAYEQGLRRSIQNKQPPITHYGVNEDPDGDIYYKASNMIHTIRQIINNDEKFRKILIGLNKEFYHQTVTTNQVENYISKKAKIDFSKIFDQYLRNAELPTLEYKFVEGKLHYRFNNCIDGFSMLLKINYEGERWITATKDWKSLENSSTNKSSFVVDPNFYINVKEIN